MIKIKNLILRIFRFARSSRKKAILVGLSIIILLISISALILYFPRGAKAAWFDDNWAYRQKVTITNSGSAQTNFQVSFTMDTATLITAGKMLSTCNDIRITDINGNLLPYWIEQNNPGCNNSATSIWTKVSSIPTTNTILYVYYGNSSAPSISSGTNVFIFFDDFSAASLDTTKWSTAASNGGTQTVSGGTLTVATSTANTQSYVSSTIAVTDGVTKFAVDQKVNFTGVSGTDVRDRLYGCTAALVGSCYLGPGDYGVYSNTSGPVPQAYWNAFTATAVTSAHEVKETISYDATNFKWSLTDLSNNTNIYNNSIAQASLTKNFLAIGATQDIGQTGTSTQTVDWIAVRKTDTTVPSASSTSSEEVGTGPIAYWKFDEGFDNSSCNGGTNDTCDSSSNNNGGDFTGSPTWKTEDMCVSGKCLYFDGTTEYVTTTNSTGFNPTTSWTAEAWVKGNTFATDTNERVILFQKDGTGTGRALLYASASTSKIATTAGGVTTLGPTVMTTNVWYHVAAVYDSSTGKVTVYTNGLSGNANAITPNAADGAFLIGINKNVTNGRWNGFIDDVKIYPYARSQAQINTDYVSRGTSKGSGAVLGASSDNNSALSNGLVGYWKLDEASGNRTDSSGNAYTLTDKNSVTANPGQFGNAGQFTRASSQALYAADNSNLSLSGTDFTLTAWVYQDSTTAGDRCIICKADVVGNKREYILTRSTGGPWSFAVSSNGTTFDGALTSAFTPSASTWYFVVAWYDSTKQTLNLQVNNGAVESTSFTGTVRDDTSEFMLGGAGTDTALLSNFDGRIDEARVYRRALNNTERDFLYNWAPGPVGYWNFNENTGTNTFDLSGSGINGTTNGTFWVPGRYGSALYFDAADHFVDLGDNFDTTIAGANKKWTMEAWVNPHSVMTGLETIIGKRADSGCSENQREIQLALSTGSALRLRYDMTVGDGTVTRAVLGSIGINTPGTWYHVVVEYDGTIATNDGLDRVSFYINGAKDPSTSLVSTTGTLGNIFDSTAHLGIGDLLSSAGASCAAGNDWDGTIDDVKIYNYLRTSKQVVQDMNGGHPSVGSPTASPLHYWRLDEGYGTTAHDTGREPAVGTLNSFTGPTPSGWNTVGKVNTSVTCDGTNDNITSATFTSSITADVSVSMWFKATSNQGGTNRIFDLQQSGSAGLNVFMNSGASPYVSVDNTGPSSEIHSQTGMADSNWHHLVVTRNGTNYYLYIDGQKKGYSTGSVQTYTKMNICQTTGGVNFFNGQVDEIKIYNYALTDNEVKLDYNLASTANFATGASTESTLFTGGSGNAPLGYYTFDENTGTSLNNITGNGATGVLSGTTKPVWVPGKLGEALKFDGTTSDVILDDPLYNSFCTSASDFTISAWFKFNAASGANNAITYFGNSATTSTLCGLSSSTGHIRFEYRGDGGTELNGGANYQTTAAYDDLKWHYASVVKNGTVFNIYVDGILQNTLTDASSFGVLTTNKQTIGNSRRGAATSDSFFNGDIDEVKLYTYARTQAQEDYDYNRGAPLVWYRFDECQGATAHSTAPAASGLTSGLDGTITIGGTGTYTTPGTCGSGTSTEAWNGGTTGKRNGSLAFDGTDDYVDLGTPTALNLGTTDFSTAAWIKTTNGSEEHIIGRGTGGGTNSYIMRVGSQASCRVSTSTNIAGTSTLSDGNWHFVACSLTRTGQGILYVDGKEEGRQDISGTSANAISNNNWTIGAEIFGAGPSRDAFFNGQIDEVRIYTYALSANQIKQVYNNGAAFFGPATGNP